MTENKVFLLVYGSMKERKKVKEEGMEERNKGRKEEKRKKERKEEKK